MPADPTPLTEEERAAIGIEPLIAKKAGRALSPVDSAMAVGIELGASLARDFYSERERASKESVAQAEAIYRKWRELLQPFLPETAMTGTGDTEALDELGVYLKRVRERERVLLDALQEARSDVLGVLNAGFDSTRREVATRAVERIDAALEKADV